MPQNLKPWDISMGKGPTLTRFTGENGVPERGKDWWLLSELERTPDSCLPASTTFYMRLLSRAPKSEGGLGCKSENQRKEKFPELA